MKTKVTSRVVTKNNRTPQILAALKRAHGSYVTVGVHEGAGSYPTPDGPPVWKVALWNEYGTEHMPARPFMAPAMMRNRAAIAKVTAKSLAEIAYLKHTVAQGLTAIGLRAQIAIQNVIKSNVGPALSGSYDPPSGYLGWRRRNYPESGQRTLIASGLLLRSVQFVLHLAGKAAEEKAPAEPLHSPEGHGHKPDARQEGRAQARKQGEALKQQRREQRKAAAADPAKQAAAFAAQHHAYERAPRKP